jgi:hypothetical protein
MKTYNENYQGKNYKSGRNVALGIYVILTTTLISAYTMVQLFQVV